MRAYLQLMRPANLVTAVADVLAGAALGSVLTNTPITDLHGLVHLMLATICLYGGGVVMNDVFDAELDAVERPERPIPGGRVSKQGATLLGVGLLLAGIVIAALFREISGLLAVLIALLAVVYDRYGKHHPVIGPINMGLCRGVNLQLGMTLIITGYSAAKWLGLIPVIYIAAITMISRDEVHGGKRKTLYWAGILYALVSVSQLVVATQTGNIYLTAAFVVLHLFLILKPLLTAIRQPIGPNIGKAVKAGVLSLIVMDAAWVSVSGNWMLALGVLALLPVSMLLAKAFAVT
ncbi:UbiA-like protein EboC [Arsenicibacter rosenii]|nr:UbiA-like protein EboC [Arsenicibacter rosenii]